MAAFKPHYTLCPLLGAHNLVGVSADKEESTVLVTLGPNIVVKHKLSDQKLLKSWSTRQSNQITCKSVYNGTNDKYVCVLNRKHICMWSEEESNLEDVKKHTFSTNIHTIHSPPGKSSIIVYENGYSECLEIGLTKRKDVKPSLLDQNETVAKSYLEVVKNQSILVLCTSGNKIYYVRLASDGTPDGNLNFSLTKGTDCKNLGMVVVNDDTNIVTILVLWSDGELVRYSEQGGIMSTYSLSGICLSSPVAMVKLDATHIAIYGADVSEEGATLLLFDLKFGMSVANRKLKFFCDPPHMYCLESNNVLLLCIVQNLVVVPYVLQPSLLCNLIDSKHIRDTNAKPDVVGWGEAVPTSPNPNPLKFRQVETTRLSNTLWESNASSSRIFDELLPLLKEDKDINGICLLLSSVKDLPEKWLADLLNFSLEINLIEGDKLSKMLEILLSLSHSDVVLLNHLRRKMTTQSTIKLLQYLAELLKTCKWAKDETSEASKPDFSQVVDWISLILDAHHHELLIAGSDDQVKQLIKQLGQLVGESYDVLDSLGQSEPLVTLLEQKRRPPENRRKDWYAIEVVRLL